MAARFRGTLLAAMLAAFHGCGQKPEGTYQSATGVLSVEFKSGRAYLTMQPAGPVEVPFDIEGDRVTLRVGGEKLVFTRHRDDSLEAPAPVGTLFRKRVPYTEGN